MSAISKALLLLIRVYRFLLSPWIGGSCRYWPSCSDYSTEAITRFGALHGAWLTVARLGRCHPYGRGGVDPVPAHFQWRCRCATPNLNATRAPGPRPSPLIGAE